MKNNFLAKHARWGNWLLVFCIINILTVTDLLAAYIQTIDKDGVPPYSTEQIKRDPDKFIENPDRFIENMKTDLRYGNLDSIGFLAERLIETGSDDPDVRALYSIFLSSKEDIEKARQELKIATKSQKETQYSLYAKAMILRIEKQYSAAIEACKKAITIDKSHPYPRNILGRTYFDRQEYKKAIASFQKAVELVPNFLPAYVNLGAVYFLMGDLTQSINHFQKAIKLNSNSYSAHYGLAVVYESEGKIFLALEEFKKSLELNPDNPTALQKLGELQLKAEKYKDALSTGEKMSKQGVEGAYEMLGDVALHLGDTKGAIRYLEKAPANSYTADYLRGFCFMIEGNHNEALKYMENVLQKNKEHFGAYAARIALKFYLGQRIIPEKELSKKWGETLDKLLYFMAGSVYAADENWSDAIKNWIAAENLIGGFSVQGIDLDTLAKGMKKDEFRYLNLGVLYYFKNLNQNALSEFEQALKINKDSILANYWAAQVHLKKGERTKAVNFLKNATQKAPSFFTALYAIGELNFLMGKLEIATQYYQRASTVKKDAGILIKLGLIFENSKEYEKAEKQYEEVTRLFPDLFVGYNQLAWVYAKRGVELEKAMDLAKKADELQPGNASILDTIGWIYFKNNQYDKSIEYLENAIKITPQNPSILYHLGAVYHSKGSNNLAKNYLKKALEISNKFEEANEARELLNVLK